MARYLSKFYGISLESEEVQEATGVAQASLQASSSTAQASQSSGSSSMAPAEEVQEDLQAVEEGAEVVEELEEVEASNAEKLENDPGSITEEDVQATQVAVESAMVRLGYPRKHVVRHRISSESALPARERLARENAHLRKFINQTVDGMVSILDKVRNKYSRR